MLKRVVVVAVRRCKPRGIVNVTSWAAGVDFVIGHSLALFPAVVAAVGMLGARILMKKDRATGFVLLMFAFPIAALDIYLIRSGGLSTTLRYQIFVIPYAFVVCVYVLRSLWLRPVLSSLTALGMVVALGPSNIGTAFTISDTSLTG